MFVALGGEGKQFRTSIQEGAKLEIGPARPEHTLTRSKKETGPSLTRVLFVPTQRDFF